MRAGVRARVVGESLRASLWFLPAIGVVLAVVAGLVTSRLGMTATAPLGITVLGARSLVEVVAGSTLTVLTLMYSLTIVALQIASTQFSPRLLRTFLRDLGNQIVLAVFLGTFAFCLAVLPALGDEVPVVALAGVVVLTAASLAALVYFINHIAQSIRIDTIMRHVEHDTLVAIDRVYPEVVVGTEWQEQLPLPPPGAVPVMAHRSGFIRLLQPELLVGPAARLDVVVGFERMVGEHVVAGVPLAWVWGRAGQTDPTVAGVLAPTVNAAVLVGFDRILTQDVAFGLRQLVDVGVKSASEAVCDPATAADAIAHVGVVLSRLAVRRIHHQLLTDTDAIVRVAIPRRDFPTYLDLGISQIRRYAIEPTDTARLLLDMLRTVGRLCSTEERRACVAEQIDVLLADATARARLPADLVAVRDAAAAATAALEAGRTRPVLRDLPALPF